MDEPTDRQRENSIPQYTPPQTKFAREEGGGGGCGEYNKVALTLALDNVHFSTKQMIFSNFFIITFAVGTHLDTYEFVFRFYCGVKPMESCRVWSVYQTELLPDRLSPLSGNVYLAYLV